MFGTDILFSGYYGQRNTGDDAFVEVAQWGARQHWNLKKISFLSKSENLPITKDPVKGYPLSFPKSYSLQRKLLLGNAKSIISAGGSTFHSIPANSVKDAVMRQKKRRPDLRVGAIGVSLGPFLNVHDESRVTEYLKRMDFLCLRDKRSYDYAMSLDLPYKPVDAFDLAGVMPTIYGQKLKYLDETREPILGVSVCNFESFIKNGDLANEQRRNLFVRDLLQYVVDNCKCKIRFYIINGNERIGDAKLTMELISSLKNLSDYEIMPYDRKTENVWRSIEECDLMISTRLHASIFACFAKIPFFLIEYHKKCTDFLMDIGQHESYRVFDGEKDYFEVGEKVLSILNGEHRISPSNRSEMEAKSLLNFTDLNVTSCFQ